MNDTLFPLPSADAPRDEAVVKATPRLQQPNRAQVELRPVDLEGLLPPDHRARVVWEFVEGLDLSPLYAEIKAVEGHAGRPDRPGHADGAVAVRDGRGGGQCAGARAAVRGA